MLEKQMPILYLAPMAGITDHIFRKICFDRGCDIATTEMISAQGFLTAPASLNAYKFLLKKDPGEGTLIAQLFGHDPEYMGRAAQKLTDSGQYCGFDINMGCPAQKVVTSGSGSAIMRSPILAGQIISAVVRSTPLPVTVKMRLGWDEAHENACEIAHIAQEEGASAVTVHGRTRMQQYSGKADWEAIGRVRESVSIPVILNGDVVDGPSALEALKVSGCSGIAVGRGALGNPWVFNEIKAALKGEAYLRPQIDEILRTALTQARDMAEYKGEHAAVMEMRKHFSWYISGRRGAARLRTKINTLPTLNDVEIAVTAFLRSDEAQNGETAEESTEKSKDCGKNG